jgi:hypothetical protein
MFLLTFLKSKLGVYTMIALAVVLTFASTYGYGYMKGSAKANARIAEFEAELAQRQATLAIDSGEVTVNTITEYVDRVRIIKEKEIQYVEIATNSVPAQYILSNGFVQVHNAAATNGDANPAGASDATPSGVADNQALGTVVGNYAVCHTNAAQLTALQSWITEQQAVVAESNKDR